MAPHGETKAASVREGSVLPTAETTKLVAVSVQCRSRLLGLTFLSVCREYEEEVGVSERGACRMLGNPAHSAL